MSVCMSRSLAFDSGFFVHESGLLIPDSGIVSHESGLPDLDSGFFVHESGYSLNNSFNSGKCL
ncbi:hypothetical protein TMU01_29640 [Tenuibacillus multivorans]|nr:hypothetical protein TMU01_29640 [Tenuibacillus multivorans]